MLGICSSSAWERNTYIGCPHPPPAKVVCVGGGVQGGTVNAETGGIYVTVVHGPQISVSPAASDPLRDLDLGKVAHSLRSSASLSNNFNVQVLPG